MTGHRPFKELTKGFSDARKARVAARHSELKSEMALHELRQTRVLEGSPSNKKFGGLAGTQERCEDS